MQDVNLVYSLYLLSLEFGEKLGYKVYLNSRTNNNEQVRPT